MNDQFFGSLFQLRDKIDAADSQSLVHPGIQLAFAVKRQIALENDSVKTRQYCYDEAAELVEKSFGELHGVLPDEDCVDNIIVRVARRIFHSAWEHSPIFAEFVLTN